MGVTYNIVIAIAELIYAFLISVIPNFLVQKRTLSRDNARKIVHIFMGGLIVFWFLYTAPYGRYLFLITPLVLIAILLSNIFGNGMHKNTIRGFTRGNRLKEALYGPLIFFLIFIFVTIVAYRTFGGTAALCAMVFGDGIAPFIGKYSMKKYMSGRKSIEGSVSVFIGSILSMFIFFRVFFSGAQSGVFIIAIVASIVAAIVEGLTPRDYDNLTVPLFVLLVFAI